MSTGTSLAPSNLTEAISFAERIAKSSLIPTHYRNKPEDCLVALQMGYELGLAPLQALQNIACINGKPSIYGDAALALVKASAVCDDVQEHEVGGPQDGDRWGYKCIAIRKGKKAVEGTFTVGDAKRAGLWGKQGPWQSYPKRMMQMRARGFALRDAFPDVLRGLITVEEAGDHPAPSQEKVINPLDRVAPPSSPTPPPAPTPSAIRSSSSETIDNTTGEIIQASPPQSSEPQQPTPSAEPSASTSSESDPSAWPLYIPGQSEPFAVYLAVDDWHKGYSDVEDRICNGKKTLPATKQQKLRLLRDANQPFAKSRLDEEQLTNWLKVRADVLAGITLDTEPAAAA